MSTDATEQESAKTQRTDESAQSLEREPSRAVAPWRFAPGLSPLSRASACANPSYGILRIGLFFAVCIGLLYLADFAITYGLRSVETGGFGATNRIVRGGVNADIIISGSSRAQTHYDPRIIEQITGLTAFNIGRNGSQTDLQLAVLKTYLQHNRKPKLIIHNLDSFSFVTTREIYDPGQYLPYLNEVPLRATIQRVYPNAWKWRYLPLYAYAAVDMRFSWVIGTKRLLGLEPPETHISGFTPRFTEWTGEFEHFRAANPDGVRFEIEAQGIRDMEELVFTCINAGVSLLFVYSPVYLEMQQLEINRTEIFAEIHRIAQKHRVPVWDYSTSAICTSKEGFYNSQHLNARGAHSFSILLAQDLRRSSLFHEWTH